MVRRGNIKNRSLGFRQPKIYSARKEQRKPDYRKYFAAFTFKRAVFVLALAILIWWMFFSNTFVVKDVIVEGNNLISADTISSNIPKDTNIFLLNSKKIEENIKRKIPEVDAVQVYKGFPDAVKVVVVEYDQSLVWKVGDKYYLLDSQGRAYMDVSQDLSKFANLSVVEDTKQITFNLGQQIVSSGFVAFVDNINSSISESANLHPDHYSISETTYDLNLYTKEGIYIRFDTSRSSKKQLLDLKNVMVQKGPDIHEYVDLRIDGWAYYK